MALVLYRKYRPQTFAEIVGQEHVIQTLRNAIEMNLVSHAYLFAGPRGSGKTTIARLLAKAVNCLQRKKSEPCNTCSACEEINSGRALDILEIDAASNRGIDEVRELREGVRFVPSRLKYKVLILDEAHQLTRDAANALLKLVEEPPSHAMFILATTEPSKMIPTIASRCQRFDFRKLTLEEIVTRLEGISRQEGAQVEKSALELIALQAQGSLRDAESLLGQAITFSTARGKKKTEAEDLRDLLGLVETQAVSRLIELLLQKKAAEAIEFVNEVLERGRDPQEFAKATVNYLRNGMLLKINPDFHNPVVTGFTLEELQTLKSQIAKLSQEELRRQLKLFMEAENKIRYSSMPQLPLELAIIEATMPPV
jgi:DNA polymerase-3 subunit gamma/tau